MNYDGVQQSLEEFVQTNWFDTAVQYDNVAFNSELYKEFLRCTIVFGDGAPRCITKGHYRQVGLLILTVFTKPAEGTVRLLQLASAASKMVVSTIVQPVAPLVAPRVNLLVPDFFKDLNEKSGWVFAQVSCPFYYDFDSEI